MKDSEYVKINSVNPLYLIINEVDGYVKEENGNKCLILVFTDKTNKYWQNTQNFGMALKWDQDNKCSKPGEYRKDFMKIKFDSDDWNWH